MRWWPFLAFFASWLPCSQSADIDDITVADPFETRSRIIMVGGNIYMYAGVGRNITFKTTGGGKIFVDDTDVSQLPDTVGWIGIQESD
ncbi:unnamed protein product [Caenorhabditis auriculariae]|uniref:Uncharacterized protein n=1 Tax=Caenorhabditis auriculariae TaxID=2777116 RepID=A0A8S1HBJ3_9PELO|nr:unnamed protein product [Caenorhabditis auriculariae]